MAKGIAVEPSIVAVQIGQHIKREWALYVTRAPRAADYKGTLHLYGAEGEERWVLIVNASGVRETQLGRYASFLGGYAIPSNDFSPEDLAERLYEGMMNGMVKAGA